MFLGTRNRKALKYKVKREREYVCVENKKEAEVHVWYAVVWDLGDLIKKILLQPLANSLQDGGDELINLSYSIVCMLNWTMEEKCRYFIVLSY